MPDISDNAAAFLRQLSEEGAKANDKTRLFVDDSSFPDVVAERAVRHLAWSATVVICRLS